MGSRLGLGLGLGLMPSLSAAPDLSALSFTDVFQYRMFREDLSNSIVTSKAATITADGAGIGSTTGSPATLSWTPTVPDDSVTLVANDGATSVSKLVSVVEASRIPQDFKASWSTLNGITLAAVAQDAQGRNFVRATVTSGGAQQRWLWSPSASPAFTGTSHTFQIMLKPGTWTGGFRSQTLTGPEFYYDPVSRDCQAKGCSLAVVEVDATGVHTLQFTDYSGNNPSSLLIQPATYIAGVWDHNAVVGAGETFDLYTDDPHTGGFRAINQQVPHADRYTFTPWNPRTVNNLLRYTYFSPFADSQATLGALETNIDILLPTGYTSATAYPLVISLAVEQFPNTKVDDVGVARTLDLHNSVGPNGAIFARVTVQSTPWWGSKNTGVQKYEGLVCDQLIVWLREKYNIIPGRAGVAVMGYSKGGWGCMSMILRRPDAIGYAAMWDTPYDLTWASGSGAGIGIDTHYGTEAQFNLYDPKQILAANLSAVNDTQRLWIGGYNTYQTDITNWKATLTSNSVPFDGSYSVSLPTHNGDAGWMDDAGVWLDAKFSA